MTTTDSINRTNGDAWFALQTKFRYEKFTSSLVSQKGFEVLVPIRKEADCGSSKPGAAAMEKVLFPGYVFARFDVTRRLPILTTPGVYTIVGYGKSPVAIPDSEILAIKNAVKAEMPLEPCPYLNTGSCVRVMDGPLKGYEGLLVENRSSCRVVLSISLIQRSIRVQVDRRNVIVLDAQHSLSA